MGHCGVSRLEVLILFEQWAGHRLLSEKVTRPHVRAHRPVSISSAPVSEGIRQVCRVTSGLVRALGKRPGCIGRFLPCAVGRHFASLRHFGWEQCSYGLTPRPSESCHHRCLKAVCGGFGVSGGCSSAEAPLLHHPVFQTFSPMEHSQVGFLPRGSSGNSGKHVRPSQSY